jgi:hypothetical protein
MTIRATIYRGEVRTALPTHEHPDPAEHLAQDPHGFMRKWMTPHYPYPQGYTGLGDVTVGQHWTRSPQIIPERFAAEPFLRGPQSGVPMGRQEARGIAAMHVAESEPPEGRSWSEHVPVIKKAEQAVQRYEKQGVNVYADLSGGDPDRPGAAKPYKMAVVWHGEEPEHHERGTNYEDELNLPVGSHVRVTGARLWMPRSGETWNPRAQHPSTFTPEEHLAASLDAEHRSTYSHISRTSSVPWNRVQFPEPVDVPVGGRKYWNR